MQKKIPVIPVYIAGAVLGYLIKGEITVKSLYFHVPVFIGLVVLELIDIGRRR